MNKNEQEIAGIYHRFNVIQMVIIGKPKAGATIRVMTKQIDYLVNLNGPTKITAEYRTAGVIVPNGPAYPMTIQDMEDLQKISIAFLWDRIK